MRKKLCHKKMTRKLKKKYSKKILHIIHPLTIYCCCSIWPLCRSCKEIFPVFWSVLIYFILHVPPGHFLADFFFSFMNFSCPRLCIDECCLYETNHSTGGDVRQKKLEIIELSHRQKKKFRQLGQRHRRSEKAERRQSHYDWHLQLLCKQFNKNFDFQQAHKSPSARGIIEWLLTCVYISCDWIKVWKIKNLASERVLAKKKIWRENIFYNSNYGKKKLRWNLEISKKN